VSGTAPFFTSIMASGWLIALHSVFSFISCRSDRFSHWIKGNPTVLVKDGRIDREAMLNTHMSEGDLDEDLRKKGLRDAAKIAEARLGMERSLYSRPNEGQFARLATKAADSLVRLDKVLRNFWIGETSDLRRGCPAKLRQNGAMAPQLSDHRRARTWAISGAVVAFTVVVGVIARDQPAPFARAGGRWNLPRRATPQK
jgi:hypothetical protein